MKKHTPASLRRIVQRAFDEYDRTMGIKPLPSNAFNSIDEKAKFAWKKLAEVFNRRAA